MSKIYQKVCVFAYLTLSNCIKNTITKKYQQRIIDLVVQSFKLRLYG